jgi:hypothetical protein
VARGPLTSCVFDSIKADQPIAPEHCVFYPISLHEDRQTALRGYLCHRSAAWRSATMIPSWSNSGVCNDCILFTKVALRSLLIVKFVWCLRLTQLFPAFDMKVMPKLRSRGQGHLPPPRYENYYVRPASKMSAQPVCNGTHRHKGQRAWQFCEHSK